MINFLNERLPIGQRLTAIFGIDDAALAAMMAAAAEGATAAAPAVAATAEAAPVAMGAMEGAAALSPGMANMGLDAAMMPPPMAPGGAPAIMPPTPPVPNVPGGGGMMEKMMGAHGALRMASKLIPNKQAQQTLNLLSLSTGLAGAGGDITKAGDMVMGPLNDIASSTQQQEPKRLDQAMAQPQARPQPAPMQTSQPQAGMPPTRLTDNYPDMGMEDRLRMIRGY